MRRGKLLRILLKLLLLAETGGDLPDWVKREGGRERKMVIPFTISKPIKTHFVHIDHEVSAWSRHGYKELFKVRLL